MSHCIDYSARVSTSISVLERQIARGARSRTQTHQLNPHTQGIFMTRVTHTELPARPAASASGTTPYHCASEHATDSAKHAPAPVYGGSAKRPVNTALASLTRKIKQHDTDYGQNTFPHDLGERTKKNPVHQDDSVRQEISTCTSRTPNR